jgi:hypothetical protein
MTQADINRIQSQTAELLEAQLKERQRQIEAARKAKEAEITKTTEYTKKMKDENAGNRKP